MCLINSLIIAGIKSIFPLIKKVNAKPLYMAAIEKGDCLLLLLTPTLSSILRSRATAEDGRKGRGKK
jgi:hypothetical protein